MSSIKKWLSLSKGEGKFLDLKSPDFEPISGEVSHLAISGAVSTVAKRNPYVFVAAGLIHAGSHYLSKVNRGDDVYTVSDDKILWHNPVHNDILVSSASSASSYQQHGGARGTPVYSSWDDFDRKVGSGAHVHKAGWDPDTKDFFRKKGKHRCKKGYTLVKIGGAMMCAKFPRKRKKS
jgi:hypothetical protein